MGIKGGPLKKLPGGDSYIYCLQKAGLAQKPVSIDVAGLMYYCALRYETSILENDYYPSARAFQDEIVYLKFILKWDVLVVFDGKDPAWKDAAHNRCYGNDVVNDDGEKTKIRNNGTYIALCAKICAGLKIPYIVSPLEVDTQGVKCHRDENPVILTGDSGILAYDMGMRVISVLNIKMPISKLEISWILLNLFLSVIGKHYTRVSEVFVQHSRVGWDGKQQGHVSNAFVAGHLIRNLSISDKTLVVLDWMV
jgi:hypothetical protein